MQPIFQCIFFLHYNIFITIKQKILITVMPDESCLTVIVILFIPDDDSEVSCNIVMKIVLSRHFSTIYFYKDARFSMKNDFN